MQSDPPNTKRSTHSLTWLAVGAGLVLAGAFGMLALPGLRESVPTIAIGPAEVDYPAPEVSLNDLQDRPVSLSGFRGRVVVYNAWATWCPPCKEEMPVLQSYYDAHASDGLVVLAIENGEPVQEVLDFVRANGMTFPVWPDPRWRAATAFQISSLPTTVVIDRAGTVRLTWLGPITREGLEKYVTPLIEERQ